MAGKIQKKSLQSRAEGISVSLPVSSCDLSSAYEKDFYKWAADQSRFLKQKEFTKLDIENLVEEIESLGSSERRALESHLKVLLMHLLKIKYQPDYRTRSWEHSVKASRFQISKLLNRNPSMRKDLGETLSDAYYLARLKAADETSLPDSTFPEKCPWNFDECMADAGLPAEEKIIKEKKHEKNT